ncbi:hypothetical protein F5B20DRAFT_208193 [Whalleya microplaca]|nr:hypothetical protein F5B20DRAFT_208193 [Whalleya microplaca]
MAAFDSGSQEPWFLRYSVPVMFPTHHALRLIPQDEFDTLIQEDIREHISHSHEDDEIVSEHIDDVPDDKIVAQDVDKESSFSVVSKPLSLASTNPFEVLDLEEIAGTDSSSSSSTHPFIQGLRSHGKETKGPGRLANAANKMLTEKGDIAYRSTHNALLDLFVELEDVISGPRLLELLNAAWKGDPLMTLKIIFNARSIHLGKASRLTFYCCAGWLAKHHPLTLVSNLRWLSRPVIEKKAGNKNEGENDVTMVDPEPEKDEGDITRFDVKNGVAHGYWKDLLNIAALSVNECLDVLAKPKSILNVEKEGRRQNAEDKKGKYVSKEEAKEKRHDVRNARHDKALAAFNSNPVYRGLHLTITRLFAEQLKSDLDLLHGKDGKAKKHISLCAKWAPSHDRFHDKHTFIVSSIAEMLHPIAEVTSGTGDMDRELYLRHARELYRKDISALRAHLDIVERNLSAKTLNKIKYDRVPSIAMSNYAKIFAAKDTERFENYINGVAEGQMRISGATLLPSTLIKTVREASDYPMMPFSAGAIQNPKAAIEAKLRDLNAKVVDGQWKTLVQRIKDSGTLESSIAVCDVSGSMFGPQFPDGTCPMDTSIGLSLLLAEVTAPPFGGHFITFSAQPEVESFDVTASLSDKWEQLSGSKWGMNTNFVAVFEDLILPMAVRHNLKQEDMVKRVFVFSDMQFDQASATTFFPPVPGSAHGSRQLSFSNWSTSFERIRGKYAEAGYEMPELVFWNLAGGRAGYGAGTAGDPTAPKPVTAEEEGTAMVSGYSQGMLKVFLDNGSFEDPEEEEVEEDVNMVEGDDDEVLVEAETKVKKRKIDPMSTLKKAIGHKAYEPLKVVD